MEPVDLKDPLALVHALISCAERDKDIVHVTKEALQLIADGIEEERRVNEAIIAGIGISSIH